MQLHDLQGTKGLGGAGPDTDSYPPPYLLALSAYSAAVVYCCSWRAACERAVSMHRQQQRPALCQRTSRVTCSCSLNTKSSSAELQFAVACWVWPGQRALTVDVRNSGSSSSSSSVRSRTSSSNGTTSSA